LFICWRLDFTNELPKDNLRDIASVDEHEVVRTVQEFYGDYYAVNPDLFTLNVGNVRDLYNDPIVGSELRKLNRIRDGVLSVLLSFRAKPYIRYQGSSTLCRRVANDISKKLDMFGDVLNGLRLDEDCQLLILDRREDPVTPLLAQWTYQAMTHELIGIENNRVDLSHVLNKNGKSLPDEECKFVLAAAQDDSFRKLMFLNYGDLAVTIKEMVEEYQKHTDEHKKIDSIADMQNFIDNYGKFRSEAGAVARHVTVVSELNNVVDKKDLMKVSALEQTLACEQDHNNAVDQVRDLLKDSKVGFEDKLKVLILYALRYEKAKNETPTFKALLRNAATSPAEEKRVRLVDQAIAFAGVAARSKNGDVFSNKDLIAKSINFLSNGLGGSVKNIFTQHQPLLAKTLDRLSKGRLPDEDFPFVESPGKRV
jgi:vacuolar protein sorting-associated protein 45